MRFAILRVLALLALALLPFVACSNVPPPRYVNPQHGKPTTVTVWLDPRTGLPPQDTLAGCNYWNETDVRCVLTHNVVESDVAIIADDHPCSPNEKGSYDIAFASPARVISVRIDCFYDTSRVAGFDAEEYRSVIAHEVGHEIGIWDHVPHSCEKPEEKAKPPASRLCGDAIMNPSYDPRVSYLTPADAVAFARRDRHYTVVPPRAGIENRACVISTPKK